MMYYKDVTGAVFAYEPDGSQNALIGNKVAITEEEARALTEKAKKEYFDSLPYDIKRKISYPPIVDQLDTLYHAGYDAWRATITAIKDKYPKGE